MLNQTIFLVRKWPRWVFIAIALAVALSYLLSAGPSMWVATSGIVPLPLAQCLIVVYLPLDQLGEIIPSFGAWFDSYMLGWMPPLQACRLPLSQPPLPIAP